MGEVKLHDAVERMMRNSASRWPGRGARNRLEPECWPEMNPGFHLHPGSTVFTIGSCFARNVERHLEALGFEVPMRKFLAESATLQPLNDYELVTKYTPPSIYQELVWTKGIRDRDGIVTDEDIEPFLLDLGNGRFIDLQRRYQGEFGAGREEVLALRRILYGVFEKAFDCDAVVVTLGLIECWLDKETGQYVEFSDNLTQHADKNRFVFKRLTFQEAYEFTRKSIDLLGAGGKTNVLLTASPVPIMRTFTGDDVIVANTYSKSVLRAVAGQIAEEYSNVDYLPGYEMVMLTKQPSVWSDDLRHVEPEFVGRLVGRVCERYVVETEGRPQTGQYEMQLRIASLVKLGRFAEALEAFDGLTAADVRISHPASVLAVAEMFLHFGEQEKAYATALRLRFGALGYGEEACSVVLACAKIFDALGRADEADRTRALAVERLKKPTLVKALVRKSVTAGELATARLIIDHIEHYLADDLDLLNFAAQTSYAIEDFDSAERICRRALDAEPRNPEMLARLGYILCRREEDAEGVSVLTRALAIAPTNMRILEHLVPAYLKLKQFEDVEHYARVLIDLSPSHAAAYSWLASALKRTGRKSEALEAARRAVELDRGNERYSRYADELARDIARSGGDPVSDNRGSRNSTMS